MLPLIFPLVLYLSPFPVRREVAEGLYGKDVRLYMKRTKKNLHGL